MYNFICLILKNLSCTSCLVHFSPLQVAIMSSSDELVSFLLSRGFPLSRDHLNDLVEWLVENEVESPSDLVQLGSVSKMVDAHLQFVLLLNWLQAVVDDVSVNGLDMAPVPTVASEPVVKKARIAEVFSAPHVPECASSSLPVSTGVVADFLNLADAPSTILNITGQGPNAAISTFRDALPASAADRKTWIRSARISAVLGSCPKSRKSFRSGLTNWINFCAVLYNDPVEGFPPRLDDILAWSHTFRCVGTFCNYLGYLRTACVALDISPPPVADPALHHAKVAITKRMLFSSRPRPFIQHCLVRNMVSSASSLHLSHEHGMAMLWLASYSFLLRVPSEALPMMRGGPGVDSNAQSVLLLDHEGSLVLRLKSRKNKQTGSVLKRKCSCSGCPTMCAVHGLWHGFFAHLQPGSQPWADISATSANRLLREAVGKLGMPEPNTYCTHGFRRGHAKDLQQSGAPLTEILAAGEWRSRAVTRYLDLADLETEVVLEAAMVSDNDEWID